MMPVMNGYETMAAIRQHPRFADLPIIAVTGKVIGDERKRCLTAARRLHLQAGRHGRAADGAPQMAPGQGEAGRAGMSTADCSTRRRSGRGAQRRRGRRDPRCRRQPWEPAGDRFDPLPLGHTIVEAIGEAALRAVLEASFAVILMDVQMPAMDGYETAKLIRLRRESERTPIIFVTAHERDECRSRWRTQAARSTSSSRRSSRTFCARRSRSSSSSSSRRATSSGPSRGHQAQRPVP